MRYVSRNHVNCCTTTATSCTSNPQQINKLEHRRFLLTTQSTCRCDVPNGSCTFIFWIYPHFLIMQCRKEAPVSKTLQLDSSNHLHTIIIIILIIKHIYIAQVRKGHKCAMSAEMAVWLRNCLSLCSYIYITNYQDSYRNIFTCLLKSLLRDVTWNAVPQVNCSTRLVTYSIEGK